MEDERERLSSILLPVKRGWVNLWLSVASCFAVYALIHMRDPSLTLETSASWLQAIAYSVVVLLALLLIRRSDLRSVWLEGDSLRVSDPDGDLFIPIMHIVAVTSPQSSNGRDTSTVVLELEGLRVDRVSFMAQWPMLAAAGPRGAMRMNELVAETKDSKRNTRWSRSLLKRYIVARDMSPENVAVLFGWCLANGADEFTLYDLWDGKKQRDAETERVAGRLAEFANGLAKRPELDLNGSEEYRHEIPLWRFNMESFGVLMSAFPKGLMTSKKEELEWFMDPILYRKGEIMLGVSSRAGEAVVQIWSYELPDLTALGNPLRLKSQSI